MSIRKQHNNGFKAQVALEAIRNQSTITEIASENGVHPSQVNKWKKQALDGLPSIFSGNHDKSKQNGEKLQAELYQQIGQLKVELAQKKSRLPRLRRNAIWWNWIIKKYVYPGSVNCLVYRVPVSITSRLASLNITCS